MYLISHNTQLKNICYTALLLFISFFCSETLASVQDQATKLLGHKKLRIVTEHLPPLQVVENDIAVRGMAVDIVNELLKITGEQAIIEGHNWARAYKLATEEPNVMIFSITRNHIREKQFHWVGMIDKLDSHLWRLKSRTDIKITQLEEAKRYSVAVPKGDIQHQILKSHGFKESEKLIVVTRYSQSLKMLLMGRVDLIIGNTMVLKDKLSPLGHNFKKIHPVIEIRNNIGDIYIAFSLSTPIARVEKYRAALKTIKDNGVHREIIDRYVR